MSEHKLAIVFDGPPGDKSGRFIEVELDGRSIDFGEWRQNGDFWELVLPDSHTRLVTALYYLQNPFPNLPESQREVARLAALGLTNAEISAGLGVSPNTVGTHVNRALKRLGKKRKRDLTRLLIQHIERILAG